MATANMNLTLPVPTVTLGPTYATQNNTAFETIDEHDHSNGKGVKVTPAGLNIDREFDINQQIMENIGQARFFSQAATLSGASDLNTLYAVGDDIYYRDGSGNNVRITNGGALDASSIGGITSLTSPAAVTYNSASTKFLFESNSGTGVPATLEGGDVIIREEVAGSASITLESPTSLASAYTITLPAATPGSKLPVLMDATGALTLEQVDTAQIADSSVTTAKINNLAVTTAKIADSNVTTAKIDDDAVTRDKLAHTVIGSTVGSGTVPASSTGTIASITTHGLSIGRAILITVRPSSNSAFSVTGSSKGWFRVLRDGTTSVYESIEFTASASGNYALFGTSFFTNATNSSHTYQLQFVNTLGASATFAGVLFEVTQI